MNLFYLDDDPIKAARMHCDKHILKMIIEYAQMLSTAHRVLDGTETTRPSKTGKTVRKHWQMSDNSEAVLYMPSHVNHPSCAWLRSGSYQYLYGYTLFRELCNIYRETSGRDHTCWSKLGSILAHVPSNIPHDTFMTQAPQCMPDQYKGDCTIEAYRRLYNNDKVRFAKFTRNPEPEWWSPCEDVMEARKLKGDKALTREEFEAL